MVHRCLGKNRILFRNVQGFLPIFPPVVWPEYIELSQG